MTRVSQLSAGLVFGWLPSSDSLGIALLWADASSALQDGKGRDMSCLKMGVSALDCNEFPVSAGAQQRPVSTVALLDSSTVKALPAWPSHDPVTQV